MSEQNTPDVQNVEQQGDQADVAVEQTSEQALSLIHI